MELPTEKCNKQEKISSTFNSRIPKPIFRNRTRSLSPPSKTNYIDKPRCKTVNENITSENQAHTSRIQKHIEFAEIEKQPTKLSKQIQHAKTCLCHSCLQEARKSASKERKSKPRQKHTQTKRDSKTQEKTITTMKNSGQMKQDQEKLKNQQKYMNKPKDSSKYVQSKVKIKQKATAIPKNTADEMKFKLKSILKKISQDKLVQENVKASEKTLVTLKNFSSSEWEHDTQQKERETQVITNAILRKTLKEEEDQFFTCSESDVYDTVENLNDLYNYEVG